MKLKNTLISALITAAMLVVLLGFGFNRAVDTVLSGERFLQGIWIDGMDVSGMTLDEASNALKTTDEERLDAVVITVQCGDTRHGFTARELGAATSLDEAIYRAYRVGRGGADMERLDIALAMSAGGSETFHSTLEYDREAVRNAVAAFADSFYREPVNATADFDVTARAFSYTPERDGRYIDSAELADLVWQRLQADAGGSLTVEAKTIAAERTEGMLRQATTLLGSERTKLPDDEGKDHNIALAAQALNGYVVMPGETFSLNALTGERTEEKGYMRVQVVSQGDEGGGVSQLAGTLYRASLLADMEIVERKRLSAPAAYLPLGFDAALEWNDKDIKCKNNGAWPLYIASYIESDLLRVDIYGAPRTDKLTVKLVNEVVETIKPAEPQLIYDAALAEGQRAVEIHERNGYYVNTYRQYLLGGEVVENVRVTSDHYPAVRGRIRVGTHSGENAGGQ